MRLAVASLSIACLLPWLASAAHADDASDAKLASDDLASLVAKQHLAAALRIGPPQYAMGANGGGRFRVEIPLDADADDKLAEPAVYHLTEGYVVSAGALTSRPDVTGLRAAAARLDAVRACVVAARAGLRKQPRHDEWVKHGRRYHTWVFVPTGSSTAQVTFAPDDVTDQEVETDVDLKTHKVTAVHLGAA